MALLMPGPSAPDCRPPSRRLAIALAVALLAASRAQAQAPDLTTLSLEQLLQVPVLGASKYEQRQRDVAAAVAVITREQILSHGWRTIDEALASLPGIHVTYDRQYTYLGSRGFGLPGDYNTRLLVAINGNRINDVLYDGGPFGRQLPLDLDLVERIEYIAGPGGAVYGQNAMFGVVNIVTRDGASASGAEVLVAGSTLSGTRELRASLGQRFGEASSLLLSASGQRARGQDLFYDFGAAGVSGTVRGRDGEWDNELFARFVHHGFAADLITGNWRKADPTASYLTDPFDDAAFQGDRYVIGQLEWNGQPGADTTLALRLFGGSEHYTGFQAYGGVRYRYVSRADWRGGELRLVWSGWSGHKLMLGLEAQDSPGYTQEVYEIGNPAADFVVPGSGWRQGLYLQDEWTLSPALRATLGVRLDRNNATGSQASPRVGLIARAGERTTFKLLGGRAHRAPNAYEREYDDGLSQVANLGLRGETIDTWEAIAEHQPDARTQLRASAYRWTIRRLIVLGVDEASGLTQYQSGGDVDAKGLELSFERRWGTGITTRGSLSLQRVGEVDGAPVRNSPRQLFKFQADAPLPWGSWHAAWTLRAESSRRTVTGASAGGHAVSDLALRRPLGRAGELLLAVTNLFDKRHAHPGADTNWQDTIEQDGRALRMQWRVGF